MATPLTGAEDVSAAIWRRDHEGACRRGSTALRPHRGRDRGAGDDRFGGRDGLELAEPAGLPRPRSDPARRDGVPGPRGRAGEARQRRSGRDPRRVEARRRARLPASARGVGRHRRGRRADPGRRVVRGTRSGWRDRAHDREAGRSRVFGRPPRAPRGLRGSRADGGARSSPGQGGPQDRTVRHHGEEGADAALERRVGRGAREEGQDGGRAGRRRGSSARRRDWHRCRTCSRSRRS